MWRTSSYLPIGRMQLKASIIRLAAVWGAGSYIRARAPLAIALLPPPRSKGLPPPPRGIPLLFMQDGQTQIDVRLENETVWLTQAQMAELFETDRTSIVRHINNIYKVDELDRDSTCAKIAQVQTEGKRKVKRTIRSAMATSVLLPHCSCGSSTTTAFSIVQMVQNAWLIIPSSL